MIQRYTTLFILLLLTALLLNSCSTTRLVADDEYLLDHVEIKVDNKSIKKSDLSDFLRQKPNSRILTIFRFQLGLYNLSSKKKEEGLMKRIGQAPVIYDAALTDKTKIELLQHLNNLGYYDAKVKDNTEYKKKKVNVKYKINAGEAHRIRNFSLSVKDDSIKKYVNFAKDARSVRKKSIFNATELDALRNRIVTNVRNKGYYQFNKELIYYIADTIPDTKLVDLTLVIDNPINKNELNSTDTIPHEKYTIRNYTVYPNYNAREAILGTVSNFKDTTHIDNYTFISDGNGNLKNELIIHANHIDEVPHYNPHVVERTYNQINRLQQYRVVNISFKDIEERDSLGNKQLDCIIQLTPSNLQSYAVELEGTNTSGNLGIGANANYSHRNLFHGGEIFKLQIKGGIERQKYGVDNSDNFSTIEYGADVDITVPKFIFPIRGEKWFNYATPTTKFLLQYNYQRRPDYTRTIASAGISYKWKSSENITQTVNPIDINLVRMFEQDSAFLASIENLSIKASYTNHSISAFSYSFTYNTQDVKKRKDYTYFKAKAETSGNILQLMSKALDREQTLDTTTNLSQYSFFGTPYAQYIKTDFEYRKGNVIDKHNTIVYRGFIGIAVPYGNSNQMPFERKYFSGGANGIRGWGVRTLGPGTYKAVTDSFPNQTGDIKLEANMEYRFKMINWLEGALFVDAGNIWSLNDNREGSEFKFNKFYNEFAVSTGFGLRGDFNYAILRFDMGIKLRDPSEDQGERWLLGNRKYTSDDFAFSFAIGYPF